MEYLFSNVVGVFVFDKQFRIVDKILFNNIEQYRNKKCEAELRKKHKAVDPGCEELRKILEVFRDSRFFKGFYEQNMLLTKELIKESVKGDVLIIQAINNIGDIDKVINVLVKRLRDWYELYNPEFSHSIADHETFVGLVLKEQKKAKGSMGGELSKEDLEPIMNLAEEIKGLFELRGKQESYMEGLMKEICPSLLAVAGASIGAKLIEQAGSLKSLMEFPASTIQLLGAERALFRHMRDKRALCPKYGYLHEHPLVLKNKKNLRGKIARQLADKLSIAVKVDYFKGEFIGDKLRKGLEEKWSK